MKYVRQSLLAILAGTTMCLAQPAPSAEPIIARGEHLYRGQQRVRLWGINFCAGVKQTNSNLPLCFDRLTDAGFNAVRLNLFDGVFTDRSAKNSVTPLATTKGDDSHLDRLDHCLKLAAERGMVFWFSFDRGHSYLPGDYDLLPDDGTRDEWNKLIKIHPANLVYLSERAEHVHQQFAKAILEHVNPWTGVRYADDSTIALYEIFNENGFINELVNNGFAGTGAEPLIQRKWNAWLKERYRSEAELAAAWGGLQDGESLASGTVNYAPVMNGVASSAAGYQSGFTVKDESGIKKFSARRGEDVVRFACDLYIGHTQRFRAFVRSLGNGKTGISVAPLTPTGRFGSFMPAWYAANCGDFASSGLYGFAPRPWEVAKTNPYFPHMVRVNMHPMLEHPLEVLRPAGKPYLFYEVNDYRPNPYTAEFSARMALAAGWNDMDGVFWFNWDAEGYLPAFKTDADYTGTNSRLPMPDTNYPNAGLLLANDEMALAGIKAAGQLYRTGALATGAQPVPVALGSDTIFDLAKTNLPGDMEWMLRTWAWRRGVAVKYTPDQKTVLPRGFPKATGDQIQMGPFTLVNWQTPGNMKITAPTARAFVGFFAPENQLGDLTLTGLNQPFGAVYFTAEDGRPLASSRSILVSFVGRSTNTGFQIDYNRMKALWAPGLAESIANAGNTPVIVDRLAGTASAPWLRNMRFEKYDFARKCYAQGQLDDATLTIDAKEPMFYARLTRP